MSYYPLITGNSSATLFNRLKNGVQGVVSDSNIGTLTKKLVAANGYEFIYTVLIIENNGTAGSALSIDSLFITDAANSPTLSGNGINTETLDGLFCLSPLKKTAPDTWTANYPFMGLVDSSYAVTKEHTEDLTAGNLSQNYVDAAIGANTFLNIGVDVNGALIWLDKEGDDDDGNAQDIKGYIPLYTAAQLVANDIPAGSYGAVLIKCDVTSGFFNTQRNHKLKLNHNGSTSGGDTDFDITLSVTGNNEFILSFLFNGVAITSNQAVSPLYSTMSPMPVDYWSGTSWRTNFTGDGQIFGLESASTSTLAPTVSTINSSSSQADSVSALAAIFAGVNDYTDYLLGNSTYAVEGFVGNKYTISDASSIPTEFGLNTSESNGSLLSEAKSDLVKYHAVKHTDDSGTFSLAHDYTSNVLTSGTHTLDATTGLYPNFVKADITTNSLSAHSIAATATILRVPYCVYPLFTYSDSTLTKINTNINLITDTSGTTNLYERDTDTYATITPSGDLTPLGGDTLASSQYNGGKSTISSHNVRINTLSGSVINDPFSNYSASNSIIEVRDTAGEDTFTTTGTTILAAINTNSDSHDFTVLSTKEIITPSLSDGIKGVGIGREDNGSYTNSPSINGVHSVDNSFKAPVTSWVKENSVGSVPYYESIGAAQKTATFKEAHYDARPLIHVGFDAGSMAMTNMEFLAPVGYTPTGDSLVDGVFDYGTNEFREVSEPLNATTGTNVLTHATFGSTSNDSYTTGMQIFEAESLFGYTPIFVGDVVNGDAGNYTTIAVVNSSGVDVNAIVTTSVAVTVSIGKKTYAASSRNTTFVHQDSAVLGSYKERDRVNSSYGNDLSYRILDINESEVKVGDKLHLESHAAAGNTAITALGFVSPAINKVAEADAAGTTDVAGTEMSMYNFNPIEVGIKQSGSNLSSRRMCLGNIKKSLYQGDHLRMIYKNLGASDYANGFYTSTINLYLFNEGQEDVYIKSVETFDPYYLPQGEFLTNPSGATTPTWSVVCTAINSDSSTNTYTGADLNAGTLSPASQSDLIALPRKKASQSGNDAEVQENTVAVSFSAPTGASGSYYRAVEITYYRDISATQKYKVGDSETFRNLKERPVWVTRELIKVDVVSSANIDLFDADETAITSSSIINFGTITA
tara:strand:- start:2648 stop:6091 length:3444 start_codon:yes stop_codon:yes gene_type:complete